MGIEIKDIIDPNGVAPRFEPPILRNEEVVIKRYRIKYSVPQMVRFGMLPPEALIEYQQAKAQKAQEEAAARDGSKSEKKVNHTFWENDEGNRALLSKEEYEKFLRENSINL